MTQKTKKMLKSNSYNLIFFSPFGLKMAELLTFEVDIKHIVKLVLSSFFIFLVPPRGIPLYPITPNDPKNQN